MWRASARPLLLLRRPSLLRSGGGGGGGAGGGCGWREQQQQQQQRRHYNLAIGEAANELRNSLGSVWRKMLAAANSGLMWGGGLAVGASVAVYLLWDPLKKDTVRHSVDITARVIGEDELKGEVLLLCRAVVSEILQDDALLHDLTVLLERLAARDETLTVVRELWHVVLTNPANTETVRAFLGDLLSDRDILASLRGFGLAVFGRLAQHPALRTRSTAYLSTSYDAAVTLPETQDAAIAAVRGIAAVALALGGDPPSRHEKLLLENALLRERLRESATVLEELQYATRDEIAAICAETFGMPPQHLLEEVKE